MKNNINVWDIVSGKLIHSIAGHSSSIRCIAVSPYEQGFVSCGDDAQVKFWAPSDP